VVTTGVGRIVIVNVWLAPVQLLMVGVTVTVLTMFAPVAFAGALNVAMSPLPPAPRPMAVFEFVQTNVAPIGSETKLFGSIACPVQTIISAGSFMTGFGFTEIVTGNASPTHVFNVGVVEITVDCVMFVAFVAVKLMLVVPVAAAKPSVKLEFVQAKLEPVGLLVKFKLTGKPGQTVWLATPVTVGFGRTVTVVIWVNKQPSALPVVVILPEILAKVVFVAVKLGV
jgi:hypothetical protein